MCRPAIKTIVKMITIAVIAASKKDFDDFIHVRERVHFMRGITLKCIVTLENARGIRPHVVILTDTAYANPNFSALLEYLTH